MDRRRREKKNPSKDFIEQICSLYGDVYDDREEDSKPGGEDWMPGVKAEHQSLAAFQKQLGTFLIRCSRVINQILEWRCVRTIRKFSYRSIGSVGEMLIVSPGRTV